MTTKANRGCLRMAVEKQFLSPQRMSGSDYEKHRGQRRRLQATKRILLAAILLLTAGCATDPNPNFPKGARVAIITNGNRINAVVSGEWTDGRGKIFVRWIDWRGEVHNDTFLPQELEIIPPSAEKSK